MDFIDQTVIHVCSGDGGPGMISFRRARNQPKLGPDGGDGGFGGSVYLEGDQQQNTLATVRYKHWYRAEHGEKGGTNGKTGANGQDCIIRVPLGTVAFDRESQQCLGEVTNHGERLLLAKGGKRGIGNLRYLSSIRQAPQKATPGGPGIELEVGLELKLLADVGLAGFPNAGKSTLLSRMSAARPKVADYPFTTLVPQLGVVELSDVRSINSFVMADIPGLIEGASEGRGLGHGFLRHLERTSVVAYVIDLIDFEERKPVDKFETLRHELRSFCPEFVDRPACIILNKIDLVTPEELASHEQAMAKYDLPLFSISGATGAGIEQLKRGLFELLKQTKGSVP